jgi:hypothetical protein
MTASADINSGLKNPGSRRRKYLLGCRADVLQLENGMFKREGEKTIP